MDHRDRCCITEDWSSTDDAGPQVDAALVAMGLSVSRTFRTSRTAAHSRSQGARSRVGSDVSVAVEVKVKVKVNG